MRDTAGLGKRPPCRRQIALPPVIQVPTEIESEFDAVGIPRLGIAGAFVLLLLLFWFVQRRR